MRVVVRHPWWVLIVWAIVVAVALPFAARVTAHLSSGGFSAPHAAAAYANATVKRLVPTNGPPVELLTRASWRDARRWAEAAGIPAAWVHPVRGLPQGVLLVPAGNKAGNIHRFLGLAAKHGAKATTVSDNTLGQAVSHEALAAFSNSTIVAIPALLILLLLVFGAAFPAALPFVTAGAGTVVALAVIAVVEQYLTLSVYLLQIVAFLALGVGVDYALFIVTRYRNRLGQGTPPDLAVREAMRTSGRSVLFSGLAVTLALASLVLGGTAYWSGMALGGALSVAAVLVATHSLLPALLLLMGRRVNLGRIRFALPDLPVWGALARWATSRPVVALTAGVIALTVPAIAAPGFQAAIPANVAHMLPATAPLARAEAELQQVQGPGSISPFVLAVTSSMPLTTPTAWRRVADLTARVERLPGVVAVRSPTSVGLPPSTLARWAGIPHGPLGHFVAGPHIVDVFVVPKAGPDTPQAQHLLHRLSTVGHDVPGLQVAVGGSVATMTAFDDYLQGRLPWMALAVVLVAFVVLLAATASVVQAALGVALNGLVTLATAGILVEIVERGLFGVPPAPLNLAVVPLVFVLLFGLSMDYEVILLHRIQERMAGGGAPEAAIQHALGSTGGMIVGAGFIMVAVVADLLVSPFEILQTLAIGLVSAILLDTLVVRTFIVPALVTLLGRHAFWPWRPLLKPTATP
jgi:uncharacterized membrane protein YdfJ with MMPL/SSD domain